MPLKKTPFLSFHYPYMSLCYNSKKVCFLTYVSKKAIISGVCMKRPQIGKNIKSYRIRAKMTQQELAAVLATTQGHIGQIERGGRYPSIDMLFAIAEALNCTAADLVSDPDSISSKASIPTKPQEGEGDVIVFERGEGANKTRLELPLTAKIFAFLERRLEGRLSPGEKLPESSQEDAGEHSA